MIKLSSNKRSIAYALVTTLCFYLIISANSAKELTISIIFNLVVLAIELYSIKLISINKLQQLDLPVVNRYPEYIETLYHKLIPFLLLINFIIFVYFNPIEIFTPFVLLLYFISFSVLFINIKSYLEDKFNIELATHFIYPLTILFNLFSFINLLLNVTKIHNIPIVLTVMSIFVIVLILHIAIHIENLDPNPKLFIAFFLSTLIIGVLSGFFYYEFTSTLRTSFIATVVFYFTTAVYHHKQEGTLSAGVIFEYITTTLLGFILLYGIW